MELEPNQNSRRARGTLVPLARHADERGALVALSFAESLPFAPVRCFFVSDVAPGTTRGHHAHKECHQGLICLSGEVLIKLDDGFGTDEFLLSSSKQALHIPPLVWGTQTYLTPGASLLVFASGPYDRSEYISDYQDFVSAARRARAVRR